MPILIPMNANPVPPVPSASGTLASLAAGTNPVGSTLTASTAGPYGVPYAAPNFGVATPSATYAPPVFSTPAVMPAAAPTLSNLTPLTSATSVPRLSTPSAATSVGSAQPTPDSGSGHTVWGTIGDVADAVAHPARLWNTIFGSKEPATTTELQRQVNDRFTAILGQYGATPDFIAQAQHQFGLALQVQYGDEGPTADESAAVASDVLNGMIGEWQRQQSGVSNDPYGDARKQLEQDRQAQMAQIAATQSWMQPMIEQQLGRANSDAGAYTQAGLALANQVTDPAMSAALSQLARSYSSDQSTANALMMQQAQLAPQSLQAQMDQQYQSQLQDLALQEAQYNQDTLASGGTLPGQAPIIGGIPLAPLPAMSPATVNANANAASVAGGGPGATDSPAWQSLIAQSLANSGNTLAQAPPAQPGPNDPAARTMGTRTGPGVATATGSPAWQALIQQSTAQAPVSGQYNTNTVTSNPGAAGGAGLPVGVGGPPGDYTNPTDLASFLASAPQPGPPQTGVPMSEGVPTGIGSGPPMTGAPQSESVPPPYGPFSPQGSAPWLGSGANGGPPVNGTEAPVPTAVGPAADITHMFDSWGPTYARQWYQVNASSLSQRERENAETWLRRHPQIAPTTGTTVPIQQLPPVAAPLAPVAPPPPTATTTTTMPQ